MIRGIFGPTPPHKRGEIPSVPHCGYCTGRVWLYDGIGYATEKDAREVRRRRIAAMRAARKKGAS